VAAVREDLARATRVFGACRAAIARELRASGISPQGEAPRAVFAMALAHRFAPYGPASSVRLADLLRYDVLDCDNYIALAFHLYRRAGGRAPVQFVGWEGGRVGNHAQMWVEGMLLDPTLGIATPLPLRRLLAGGHAERFADLSSQPPVPGYRERVVGALREGAYRRRDLLYWADELKWFIGAGRLLDFDGELRSTGLPRGLKQVRTSL
jgi:hypothetical protein